MVQIRATRSRGDRAGAR